MKKRKPKGIYKNADLLKMHAYKDAIRRTSGAYILYPGDKPYNEKGFHEIIPGLGAFPVNPRNKERHVDELKTFVQEIVEHLVNLCTQREKIALQNYDIHKKPAAAPPVKEPYPEIYNENRDMIPDETFILVGFCKSEEHYDWIKNNMLYTLGLVYKGDPIGITRERINSRFVLLYSLEEDESLKLLKIKRDYTEFFSRQDLLNLNYPTPTHDSYLVFHLQEVTEPELKDIKLDITKLKVDKGKDPLVISLAELMKYKVL